MGILRDLILIGTQDDIQNDRTTTTYREEIFSTEMLTVLKCAYFAGILLIITALAQAFFTMYFPVADTENAIAIYVRNISSVIAFTAIGTFLIIWCDFASDEDEVNPKLQRSVRFLTILTAISSFAKGAYSLFIVFTESYRGIITITYYATDGIAWFALSLFAIIYFRFDLSDKSHIHRINKYRAFTIAITTLYYLKTFIATAYTLIRYNPHHFPWLYYLVSAIAWLSLAIFFSLYSRSWFILMPEKGEIR